MAAIPYMLRIQSAIGIEIDKAPLISIERIQALDTVGAVKEKRDIMTITKFSIVTMVFISVPVFANIIGKYAIPATTSKRPVGISFAKKFFIILVYIILGGVVLGVLSDCDNPDNTII